MASVPVNRPDASAFEFRATLLNDILLGLLVGWWITPLSRPVEVRLRKRAIQRLAFRRLFKFIAQLQAPKFAARYFGVLTLLVRWIAVRMLLVGWQLSLLAGAYLIGDLLWSSVVGGSDHRTVQVELGWLRAARSELVYSVAVMGGALLRAVLLKYGAGARLN